MPQNGLFFSFVCRSQKQGGTLSSLEQETINSNIVASAPQDPRAVRSSVSRWKSLEQIESLLDKTRAYFSIELTTTQQQSVQKDR
jgi:hypothetical protein